MDQANKALQAAGIIWHPCTLCKVTWPFPRGVIMDMREWVCCICSYARWAKFQREMESINDRTNGFGINERAKLKGRAADS